MKKNKKNIIILISLLCSLIIIYILIQIKNIEEKSFVKFIINDQEILIDKNTKETTFDLNTLNTEYDTIVKIEPKNAKIKIKDKKINNKKEISLGKLEINSNNQIEIQVKLFGELEWKSYKINTLPSQFPEYEFDGQSSEDGEYYVTTYQLQIRKKQHYIYKLNKKGEIIFYRATPNISYNFKKNIVNDKIRYTYLESYGELSLGFTLSLPTKLIVLDEQYNKINEIYYTSTNDNEEKKLDNHDYLYLSDNHYILSGFEQTTVYNFPEHKGEPFDVWNCKIQEVLDGKVVWEFQSIENEFLYDYCDEENRKIMTYEPCLDYIHFNSMQIDPADGNLVCSFRNIDSIIKLDRKTGKVIWILGGNGDEFGLTEQQKFSKQHSISFISDHSILIFDNGYKNEKTRILIINIDEKNKTIKKFNDYDLNMYASRMGSIQSINEESNIYLVTYGVGKHEYGFQELNLETLKPIVSFKLKEDNSLYCVNKYK